MYTLNTSVYFNSLQLHKYLQSTHNLTIKLENKNYFIACACYLHNRREEHFILTVCPGLSNTIVSEVLIRSNINR